MDAVLTSAAPILEQGRRTPRSWVYGWISLCCLLPGCATFTKPNEVSRIEPPQSYDKRKSTAESGGEVAFEPKSNGESDTDIRPVAAEFLEPGTRAIGLQEVVAEALTHNLHLRVLEGIPQEAAQRIEIERAQYDATLSSGVQYAQGNQQVASALQAVQGGLSQYGSTSIGAIPGNPNLVSVEQRFTTGTTARLGLGSNYNNNSPIGQFLIYNPAYQSAGSLVVEQAFFRGASRDANLAGLRIAQTNQRQTSAEFQVEVHRILSDVHRAYWSTWLAESQRAAYEELVEQAQTTLDLESQRMAHGEGGAASVAQAAESLHSLKADLAEVRQRELAARSQLFFLMGTPHEDRKDVRLADQPVLARVLPELEQGRQLAIQRRPEVQVRQLQLAQTQLELERRLNIDRPDVRAYAGYSLSGLGNNFTGSLGNLTSTEFGNMSLGLRYNHVFGRRAERAAVDQARLAVARQIKAREETEFMIRQQVQDAHDAIRSTWEVLQSQQERVAAASAQADLYQELYAAGQIDLDRLIRARQQLAHALPQQQRALYEYNLALDAWRFATGEMTIPEAIEPERKAIAGTAVTP